MVAILFAFLYSIYSAQSIECTVCQLVVSYAEKLVQKNESEQFIIKELDQLCEKLPVFGPQCDAVVSQYAPQLIAWLVKKEPPQQFCGHVHLCTSQKAQDHSRSHQLHQKRSSEQSVPCSLCQIIVAYVENYVKENATEQVIIQRLDAFCNDIGPLSPECQSFVSIYAPKLIEWISSKEDPTKFCAQVRICTGANHKVEKFSRFRMNERSKDTQGVKQQIFKREETQGKCQICDLVITYVEQLLVQNNTISDVEAKVQELCKVAPQPVDKLCNSIVQFYLPSMINWIVQEENPQVFCSSVKLC
jgi:saposin